MFDILVFFVLCLCYFGFFMLLLYLMIVLMYVIEVLCVVNYVDCIEYYCWMVFFIDGNFVEVSNGIVMWFM